MACRNASPGGWSNAAQFVRSHLHHKQETGGHGRRFIIDYVHS